jgi:flagellar basal-body rod protein FlgG
MANGMWPAVSGAVARSQVVDVVANNLANMDTPAFKKDLPTFKEYISTLERDPQNQEIPRGPIKDKEFYPLDGRDQSFVVVDGTHTVHTQGALRVTGAPLDLALEGQGFFEVSTPQGVRLTRQGSFKLSPEGWLVTREGHPVLSKEVRGLATAQLAASAVQPGQGRPSTQGGVAVERGINLKGLTDLSVGETGEIYSGDGLVATLALTEVPNAKKLQKSGGHLYVNTDSANVSANPATTLIRQGFIETSNVSPVEEMTKLIQANRLFELDLKGVKTYNDMMAKEVNEVG